MGAGTAPGDHGGSYTVMIVSRCHARRTSIT
ncbi:hypothetical protein CcI6DRAFT_04836, partial [Frankia sp. CcI6]